MVKEILTKYGEKIKKIKKYQDYRAKIKKLAPKSTNSKNTKIINTFMCDECGGELMANNGFYVCPECGLTSLEPVLYGSNLKNIALRRPNGEQDLKYLSIEQSYRAMSRMPNIPGRTQKHFNRIVDYVLHFNLNYKQRILIYNYIQKKRYSNLRFFIIDVAKVILSLNWRTSDECINAIKKGARGKREIIKEIIKFAQSKNQYVSMRNFKIKKYGFIVGQKSIEEKRQEDVENYMSKNSEDNYIILDSREEARKYKKENKTRGRIFSLKASDLEKIENKINKEIIKKIKSVKNILCH